MERLAELWRRLVFFRRAARRASRVDEVRALKYE
jgi:hypothetical protein